MTDLATPMGEDERPLAGEYVLGVLDAAERDEAERRVASEPAFARAVQWWETHLTPLAADVASVTPPASVWARIISLIEPARPTAWNNVRLWRGLTAAAGALAAACLVIVALPKAPPPTPVAPPVAQVEAAQVALINDPETNQARLVATLDRATGELLLTPVDMTMPEGRDAELWIIPEGQKAISLGVIPTTAPKRIKAPEGLKAEGLYTALLAVTDEPPGGAPTGVATGSVRAAGKFARA